MPKLSKEQEKQVIEMYINSKRETLTSIGKYFGVSKNTIKRILLSNNVEITYDRNCNRVMGLDEKADEIVSLYVDEKLSRNKIAKMYNTSHTVIKRILVSKGVIVEEKYFRNTNRYKLEQIVKNLRDEYEVTYDFFISLDKDKNVENIDIEKIRILNDRSKRIIQRNDDKLDYKKFIQVFYHDKQFNLIYESWKNNNKNKWLSPSIDHMVSISQGGTNDIENLQFLTWFENRAKCEMSEKEWQDFKKSTNTNSDYFIRV